MVHCASHRLNLVVNDLNKLSEIRNTIGTIKTIITFFRESPNRRSTIPNIPLFCETRWTHKYTSIRVFRTNFVVIMDSLSILSHSLKNRQCRNTANQLLHSSSNSSFIVCLLIISEYSAMLEPVTQLLQSVNMDITKVQTHIHNLMQIFKGHRDESLSVFSNLFEGIIDLAKDVGIEITKPRICGSQAHRSGFLKQMLSVIYCIIYTLEK